MILKKLKWIATGLSESRLNNELQIKPSFVYTQSGVNVVFVKDQDEIRAFKNRCPHQGMSMDGCWVEEGHIVCPVHRFAFDCETGRGAGLYIEKYPIKTEYGEILLGIEKWTLF